MRTKDLGNAGTGHQGLSFENMLQEYFSSGVLVIDSKGKRISATPEAERLLTLSTAQGKHSSSQTIPAPLQAILQEAQNSGQTISDRRIALPGQKTDSLALSVTAVPLGKQGSVLLLRDISSAAKMEQRLRRLDRLASVGTLSASMAHEIKNALVPVRTFIDLLLEKDRDSELAPTVRRELSRVDSIVANMLKFSAPGQPTFASVKLHEILDHSLRLAQHRVGTRVVSFKRIFQATPDSLIGDDHQLEQAFVNLLLNAVEAMGPEGTLTVTTELVPDDKELRLHERHGGATSLQVRIADTGLGIPPENLARIFEPFFTTKQNGTGLGLPVTRRIIEEHNGTIRVASQAGEGTTFIIRLPVGS